MAKTCAVHSLKTLRTQRYTDTGTTRNRVNKTARNGKETG